MLTKQALRSKILLKLENQKEEDRKQKSSLIKDKLLKQREFRKAKRVMFYIAMQGEVDTQEMIETAKRLGKIIAVPVCVKSRISLRPAILDSHAHLRKGPYGVSEPVIGRFIGLKDLDLVITPGVAFDKKGNRLGRGKGYYDRFLSRIPKDTPSIGLAFDLQILPVVPTTPHDVGVKKVLFA
ncbi:MAG: 5-formyltetrahydrofolate cyclo-ligase [Candidatus Omnitrophota bacterium]|jgi:5-formyltetrahydrofolate cyclo-ligase|nr:5-formyltetrahydrofolate cyclo-ligase [Candidatus Omnitrophota bacterium]